MLHQVIIQKWSIVFVELIFLKFGLGIKVKCQSDIFFKRTLQQSILKQETLLSRYQEEAPLNQLVELLKYLIHFLSDMQKAWCVQTFVEH